MTAAPGVLKHVPAAVTDAAKPAVPAALPREPTVAEASGGVLGTWSTPPEAKDDPGARYAPPIRGHTTRIGVVTFPGTCDDRDALRAVELCGASAVPLWHRDDDLSSVDAVFLPGGFSFGDHLRCGAIARFSPMMAAVARFAAAGGSVLGVCNGFQVLCEAGLLPGILRPNHHGRFNCLVADLVVERPAPWTGNLDAGSVLRIPVKHGDGAWYGSADEIALLEARGQVLLRYADDINGASGRIAGVVNEGGNVFGLMPHPEHAVDPVLGSIDGRAVVGGLLARSPVA